MQIVGDNLHEISKSIIHKNNTNIVSLSSAESPQRVVKIYLPFLVLLLSSECPAKTGQTARMLGLYQWVKLSGKPFSSSSPYYCAKSHDRHLDNSLGL